VTMLRLMGSSSGKLPVKLIIILMVFVSLGAGTMTFLKSGKSKGKAEKKPVEVSMWKLDDFVVNLSDRDGARYLKTTMVLEMEGKIEAKEGAESTSPQEAKVRDAIITILTNKSYADLVSEEGKQRLKEELKAALDKALDGPKVSNIYFTSFAMQ
jgi:flagellar protein FliL